MPISPRQSPSPYHKSGAILFIALWTLVILVILGIGISNRAASEIGLAKYLNERTTALYLAKAAVNRATLELEKDETPAYDALYELQEKRKKTLGTGEFGFNLTDEESLLNINTASEELIGALAGLNPELAKDIFASSLKPFLLKEELLLIEGITPEIFAGFKDLITVYGAGKVNINTAPSGVLEVLGLSDDLIEIILNYRKGEDAQEATQDDRKFENAGSILSDLREFTILTVEQELQITERQNLLGVNAQNLRLSIDTGMLSHPINHYTVILERSTGKIKFWQER